MKDLISVIVPIYNVEKYLTKCLDSIINQTYKNLEIILVDDGSPDNCPKICDEYAKRDKRIKVIHKKNQGVSVARNVGIESSEGKYICFVDSDDFISNDFLTKLINKIKEENSDAVICDYYTYKNDKEYKHINKNWKKIVCNDLSMYFGNLRNVHRAVWAALYKKNIIKDLRFNPELKIAEDFLFLLQVLKNAEKISYVNECLYYYFINNDSVMRTKNENYYNYIIDGLMRCKEELEKLGYETKSIEFEIYITACLGYASITNYSKYAEFEKFNKRSNYKKFLKYNKDFKTRVKAFLCKYKMFYVLRKF